MAMIKKDCEDRIKAHNEDGKTLLNVITGKRGEARREGASYKCSCPLCGSEHALVVTPGRNMFKCFNCNELSGAGAISYLMKGERMNYQEALEYLAQTVNIFVEYNEPTSSKKVSDEKKKSFCERMLKDSGLTAKDVMATVIKEGDSEAKVTESKRTFISGTLTSRGEIDKKGDDAVILYYNLEGKEMTYTLDNDKTAVERKYFRVRYQFPEEHKDKKGRAMKYRSPAGSPTFLYFPEAIRSAYRKGETIETLYIQEGEKKAEKACKHGIMSVAVSGIQNLGLKGSLPEEIITLIEKCNVREVIFLLDSDCFDLTSTITVDDPIERRPKNFYYAIRNYKEYMNRLKNRNLWVEVYFGYVLKNEKGDKGIDDLLANTLKGKEEQLLEDITTAKNEKNMLGKYVQLHKITTRTDAQIMEIWSLQSAQEFCGKYKEQLKNIPEFTFGKRKLRYNAEGNLESAQPIEPDEIFWKEHTKRGSDEKEYCFYYTGAITFLEHRGYYRYKKPSRDYDFIHVEDGIATVVQPYEVADFVKSFTKDCLSKDILEMLYKGGVQYLGPEKLGNLQFYQEQFERPARGIQHLFFANKIWQVTADKIQVQDYSQLHFIIWEDMRKDFNAELLEPLIKIQCTDQVYTYEITETGKKCDFLRFFENASNFTWRKDTVTAEEANENAQHLVSKMAAFGYLISSAKDRSVAKAVIGMDGKQSEFGESNGRSGKSLMGEAIRHITTSKAYNGKEFSGNAGKNQFIWDGITEKTNLVFIDDAQRSIDFEMLFSLITGDWPVNPKGAQPFVLPFQTSPKILVTTNFAISGDGSSFSDRQWQLAFSDFYNDEHKPIDDFKQLFFDEWDTEQWNLFWNFAATCLQVYFKFGYVPAPGDRLEVRKLMQEIGTEFDNWANAYYAEANGRLNKRISRQEVYTALFEGADGVKGIGHDRKTYYSPQNFKKRLISWCKLHGYVLNPASFNPVTGKYVKYDKDGRPCLDDKSNGIEYLTVGDDKFNGGIGSIVPPSVFSRNGEEPIELDLEDGNDLPY